MAPRMMLRRGRGLAVPALAAPVLAALLALGCDGTLTGSAEGGAGDEGWQPDNSPAEKPILPGFSVIRRLSHIEYQNTVEDLLGTEQVVTGAFPADDLGGGFATVGAALSLSPLYVMAYERAAHALVDELYASTGPGRDAILSCDVTLSEDETCAAAIVGDFARRAFRRPLATGEMETLLIPYRKAIELGATKEDGLRHSLVAVLLSPHFLFKVETDEDPDSGAARALDSYEVATRLSYALWATMPDEQLTQRADAGELLDEAAVGEEISRLLADKRAAGFLQNFAQYWLNYTRLDSHEVEPTAFPDYDPALAVSMKAEADAFLGDFLDSGRPVQEMFTANFTYVDAPLAAHYGLPAPTSSTGDVSRVDTTGTTRGGLLTLGALLMTTSFSSRTSVVVRGAYVFDRLLCGEIPPPPPGVEGLEFDTGELTQRERLDLHRQDPSCKSCHEVMDQLGFGLEHYDAIGAYRELDAGLPVDASGELPDGGAFEGAIELGAVLSGDPRFTECITQKFMTYALGRLVTHRDPWLAYLNERLEPGKASLVDILRTVLLSEAFLQRQAGVTVEEPEH